MKVRNAGTVRPRKESTALRSPQTGGQDGGVVRQAEDLAGLVLHLVLFAAVAIGLEHIDVGEQVERQAVREHPRMVDVAA